MYSISFSKHASLGYALSSFDEMFYLGKIMGYEVIYGLWGEDLQECDALDVFMLDPNTCNSRDYKKVVCQLELSRSEFVKGAWIVDMMRVDNKYRGKNIAPKLYKFLVNKLPGLIIQAGEQQSPGGQSIWSRLSKQSGVIVYGRTPKGRPVAMVEVNNQLCCAHGNNVAYDGKRDFYMFAMKAV